MIIISDFNDYYDGVAKSGVDSDLVYRRRERDLGLRVWDLRGAHSAADLPAGQSVRSLTGSLDYLSGLRAPYKARRLSRTGAKAEPPRRRIAMDTFIVLLGDACAVGLQLHCVNYREPKENYFERRVMRAGESPVQWPDAPSCWHRKLAADLESDMVFEAPWSVPLRRGFPDAQLQVAQEAPALRKLLDGVFEGDAPATAVFRKTSGRDLLIRADCKLKEWGASRAWDSWAAHQGIMMHLGRQAQAEPGMVRIGDRDLAGKKGFGHPYAFRREPQARKGKQRIGGGEARA